MLTVWAGLKLKLATGPSVTGSGARSDLQQVCGVGFQAVQCDICALRPQDGVTGFLFLL